MRSRLLSSGKIITSLPPATCCSRCVCVYMCVCVSALCLEQFCFREAHTVFNFTPWDMMIWDNGWGSEDKAFCVSSCQMFKCDLKGDWFSWWEATLGALQRSEVDEQTLFLIVGQQWTWNCGGHWLCGCDTAHTEFVGALLPLLSTNADK